MVRWIVARRWHGGSIGPVVVASGRLFGDELPDGARSGRDDRRLGRLAHSLGRHPSLQLAHDVHLLLLFPRCAGKIDNHHPSASRAKAPVILIPRRDWWPGVQAQE